MSDLLVTNIRFHMNGDRPHWSWHVDKPGVYSDDRWWYADEYYIEVARVWSEDYERKSGDSGYEGECSFDMNLSVGSVPAAVRCWIKEHQPELWDELVGDMRVRMEKDGLRQMRKADVEAVKANRRAARQRKREEKAAAALQRQRERIERLHRKNNENQLVCFG